MFKKFHRRRKLNKLRKISIEVLEFPAEQNTKPFPILRCKPLEIIEIFWLTFNAL